MSKIIDYGRKDFGLHKKEMSCLCRTFKKGQFKQTITLQPTMMI